MDENKNKFLEQTQMFHDLITKMLMVVLQNHEELKNLSKEQRSNLRYNRYKYFKVKILAKPND